MIRMKWLPTPDESLARREKRREAKNHAEHAGKPRFAAPVPLRGEATAIARLPAV